MNKYKSLIFFISKVLGIYLLWMLVYKNFLEYDALDSALTESEAFFVSKLFHLFGYEGTHYLPKPPDASVLYWGDRRLIGISDSCNGLVLFVIFSAFIISFPSKWKHRFVFLPFGLMAIYALNIARIFALALIFIYYPAYLDFNHHYTFTFFVYMDIFLIWMAYVKKFGDKTLTNH